MEAMALAARVKQLEAELHARDCVIATHQESIAKRDAVIGRQARQLADRDAELAKSKQQLAWLTNQMFGRRSERFADPSQHPLFTDGVDEAAEMAGVSAAADEAGAPACKGKKKRRGGGRRPIDPELPRVEIRHELSADELSDSETGELLYEPFGEESTEKLAFEPGRMYAERHVRVKYRLIRPAGPEGGPNPSRERLVATDPPEVVVAPPTPEGLYKCLAAPSLLAELMWQKFGLHVPFDRFLKELKRRGGVEISNATVSRWAVQIGTLAAPLVDLMRRRMLAHSVVIQHDDTPIRQQPPPGSARGGPRGSPCKKCRVWSMVGQEMTRPGGKTGNYVVFAYTQSRAGSNTAAQLAEAIGEPDTYALRFVQCDDYSGYDRLFGPGTGLRRAGCLAHARRKWHDLRGSHPAIAAEGLRKITKLYAVEAELTALRESMEPADFHAERERRRRVDSRPLLRDYLAWCRKVRGEAGRPKDPVAMAASYSLNQAADLCRFARRGGGVLEIDNNACERSIRPLCIGKKNWLFAGSEDAGHAMATIFSLIASANRHGLSARDYLEDVIRDLRSLGDSPGDADLERFLPDRWTPPA